MRYFLIVMLLGLALVIARLSMFTVDPTEYVYLTQFGRHVATYDGAKDSEAGLHFCWPWPIQSIQRVDRRLQTFDLPSAELLTHDAQGKTIDKTLVIDAYVCWKIANQDAVDRFIRSMVTMDNARSVLGKRINAQVGSAIGQMGLDDLISTQSLPDNRLKVEVKMEELREKLLRELQPALAQNYGLDLIDLRLRRFNHPAGDVRTAIFDRIRSEREKTAQKYLSDGEKQAKDIRSEADKDVKDLLSDAEKQAKIERGKAEAEADVVRTRAHSQDPEFYEFLRRLELYQNLLGENKTMLLLSTHRPLFEQLFSPPRVNGAPPEKDAGKKKEGEK